MTVTVLLFVAGGLAYLMVASVLMALAVKLSQTPIDEGPWAVGAFWPLALPTIGVIWLCSQVYNKTCKFLDRPKLPKAVARETPKQSG